MLDPRALLTGMARAAVDEAKGSNDRPDAVLPRTGGPAGNARLTAWTGMLLLVLFIAELITLLDVRGLITWHLIVGVLLVPPALLKTGSTGWRIVRYYTRNQPYYDAGPPSLLPRVLGPLVVIFSLALLGSGLALVYLGPDSGRSTIFQILGQRVSTLTLHQGTSILWGVVTGLHVLLRLIPGVKLTFGALPKGRPVPGLRWRAAGLAATVLVATIAAVIVLAAASDWRTEPAHRFGRHPVRATAEYGPFQTDLRAAIQNECTLTCEITAHKSSAQISRRIIVR